MSSALLQPNTPVKFASRNMHPSFKRLKAGDIFLIQVEVEESVWDSFRTVPDTALWENVAWWHDGDTPAAEAITVPEESEVKPEKPKREKGPYSGYWQQMFKAGFYNQVDLLEAIDSPPDADKVRLSLHRVFETDTLTAVGPRQFEEWVQAQALPESLAVMSRQAEHVAMEHAK